MDNDPLVPLVIHDAPGVARTVWLHSKIQSLEASQNFSSRRISAFIGSPVMAEKEQRHHACEMRNCKTRSCQGFM
jgi:hypothetical protein